MGSSPEICSFGTNKPGVRAGQPLPGGDAGHLKGDAGPRLDSRCRGPGPWGRGQGRPSRQSVGHRGKASKCEEPGPV